jgi:hypothetical protein
MRFHVLALVLCSLVASSASVRAQEAPAGAPTPDQMMEMMKKLAAPGPGHKVMDRMTGTFTAKMKSWMEPGKPPVESEGKQTSEWILGGRYVVDDYQSEFLGEPFHGMGINAYDNVKKEYVSTWVDTMSTGIMVMRGSYDEASKTMTMTGSFDDPMTGAPMKVKTVGKFLDDRTHVFEMYMETPDGGWFKNMEITYTRAK